ncbi:MAG: polymerase subunit sigma, partial [Ilumatobacteraceae bacterium]|nr:polymerase subunit sigma [Ilumatobacteraceae bacterium]
MTGKPTFETIVSTHGSRVLRVCRAVVGGVDADDAWADTFLAAMRAYPDLPADANIEAWLVTIAHRKAIDITRRAARRAVPMASPPERIIDAAEPTVARADIVDAVRALPPKQLQAVAYHYLA